MSERTIEHNLDCWPIAISKIYGEQHTERELNEAYSAWTGFMHRGPHVLILDMTAGNAGATAAQRAKVAEWLEANDALIKAGKQLAHVMVVNSAVVRGIITAVFWLRPPANAQHVAATFDEAVDRAVAVLKQAGIPIPPDLITRARRLGRSPPRPAIKAASHE